MANKIAAKYPNRIVNHDGLIYYFFGLTFFFVLLEVSFFIQCNKAYLSVFRIVSEKLTIPLTILPGVVLFLLSQLLVHFLYCVIIWGVSNLVARLFHLHSKTYFYFGMSMWVLGLLTILVANQFFFPNSKFSQLTSLFLFNEQITKLIFLILLVSWGGILSLALIQLLKHVKPLFILIVISLALSFYFFLPERVGYQAASAEKPNIILIGIDSLRPDFLSYFGHENNTPFIDSLLKRASVFGETVTPLARTFPSWVSILTGLYPKEIGVRFNLSPQGQLNLTDALPAVLKRHGYHTFFATDETRFSNMDKNFGFEKIISPPMGLNDFLIGSLNDFPLSNLLVNTPLGKWLFPYSYGNRAVYATYYPSSFINLMRPILNQQYHHPVFFAVHFCLPHHPYLWGGFLSKNTNAVERYNASIHEMDKILANFFSLLESNHFLDHAIVVLLSDHGEALELPGDRITEKEFFTSNKSLLDIPLFYPPSLDEEGINQSAGHGTDVLGLPQYHTLLAIKLYGLGAQQKHGLIGGVHSLLSVKPTILDLIKIVREHSTHSSQSLAAIITGKSDIITKSHIFLESDFSPEAVRTVYPNTHEVILSGIGLFEIDPKSTRLVVKDQMADMIIHSKQYADIYGDWMLALYPQNDKYRMPILINLATGKWTNDLQSNFAQQSPAIEMIKALKAFYGNELN